MVNPRKFSFLKMYTLGFKITIRFYTLGFKITIGTIPVKQVLAQDKLLIHNHRNLYDNTLEVLLKLEIPFAGLLPSYFCIR